MFRVILLLLALACTAPSPAQAGAVSFQPLPPKVEGPLRMLIGGDEATSDDFPATVYMSSGGGRCTATLIGPEVLISAAHCMADDGHVVFTLLTGAQHRARCRHHPDYHQNETADWALCYLDTPVQGAEVKFETVSMDRTIPQEGERILLSGYGCTRQGGGGGNDGTLRIGYADVIRTPRRGDWDIITRGSVALCFGDSGGPAFAFRDGQRYLISVNSRGNIKDTSYLSKTLQNGVFSNWLRNWAAANETEVCGLHDLPGCRGKAAPPPDSDPGKPAPPDAPDTEGAPWWIWALILGGSGLAVWAFVWVKNKVKGWFS